MARVPKSMILICLVSLAACAPGRSQRSNIVRPAANVQSPFGTSPGALGDDFGPGAPAGPAEQAVPPAFDDGAITRITAVNGEVGPNHAEEVYVYPGDVVTLAADVFRGRERLEAERRGSEGFAWTSSLNERCVVAAGVDCLSQSHFGPNPRGVSYYVPRDMPAAIRIDVRAPGGARPDHITLRNAEFDGRPRAPRTVIDSLEDYPGDRLDPNVALEGKGSWISIDNVRYFSPSVYVVEGETEWAPYRHGYWSWDDARGLTWDSYDPWGRITDHYGVWRHHAQWGWVWLPFTDLHYQPHVVTLFEAGDDIGWYPYTPGFDDCYRPGESAGFNDGFWLGFDIGAQIDRFTVGFAIVPRASFVSANVIDVMIGQRLLVPGPAVLPVIRESIVGRRWFGRPGGDLAAVRLGIEHRLGHPLPVLQNPIVAARGGARVFAPRSIYPVPAESRLWADQMAKRRTPVPLGMVAHPRNGSVELVPRPARPAPGPRPGAPANAPLVYDPRKPAPAAVIPRSLGGPTDHAPAPRDPRGQANPRGSRPTPAPVDPRAAAAPPAPAVPSAAVNLPAPAPTPHPRPQPGPVASPAPTPTPAPRPQAGPVASPAPTFTRVAPPMGQQVAPDAAGSRPQAVATPPPAATAPASSRPAPDARRADGVAADVRPRDEAPDRASRGDSNDANRSKDPGARASVNGRH